MSDTPKQAPEPTLIVCDQSTCKHDFYGPGSHDREFADGHGWERVCRCGLGAMAHTLSLDI